MGFENDIKEILNIYYDEYMRPFKYIDPRNVSKSSDSYLLDEHNQTVSFCNAVRKHYSNEDVVAWFELSIGKKIAQKQGGRDSTNAIDGIVYIHELDTLIIIESKGLRKALKFSAIVDDFNRTLGVDRKPKPNDYIIQMRKPSKMYAITLADIWGEKTENHIDEWDIDFKKSNLTSRAKCEENYSFYKNVISDSGKLFSSQSFKIGGRPYRLLSMVYEMAKEEIDKYTFKNDTNAAE